jgi:hypothetical protein
LVPLQFKSEVEFIHYPFYYFSYCLIVQRRFQRQKLKGGYNVACLIIKRCNVRLSIALEMIGIFSSLPCPPCTRTMASSRRPSRPFRSRRSDTTAVLCRQNPQTNYHRNLKNVYGRMIQLQLLRASLDAPCCRLNAQPCSTASSHTRALSPPLMYTRSKPAFCTDNLTIRRKSGGKACVSRVHTARRD